MRNRILPRVRTRGSIPEVLATAPNGREVWVRAVPRGYRLREFNDSGDVADIVVLPLLEGVQLGLALLTKSWVLGVISADQEPWLGVRRFHVERCIDRDPTARVDELVQDVEAGRIKVPAPRGWRPRAARQ